MTYPGPGIADLAEAADAQHYGGKAVNLCTLLRAGLPVPGGWALSVAFAADAASGGRDAIDRLLQLGDATDRLLAVRSSAVGEDSAGASYAGQHATELGVQGAHALVAATIKVALSARLASARAYRASSGETGATRMGVVIQTLLDPVAAGVMFTRDPVSGGDERVIEASWGLGESVVSGRVAPDRIRLGRDGDLKDYQIGAKATALHSIRGGGTEQRALTPEQSLAPCLSRHDLAALWSLGQRCEHFFGAPQDIEWAVADGTVWLLQSRPITR